MHELARGVRADAAARWDVLVPIPPSSLLLLQRLAARIGCAAPIAPSADGQERIDLADRDALVALDEPGVNAQLEAAANAHFDPARATAAIAKSLGLTTTLCTFADEREAANAIVAAATAKKPGAILLVGDAAERFAHVNGTRSIAIDAVDDTMLASASMLALGADVDLQQFQSLAARARAHGTAVCVDETATAHRIAHGAASTARGMRADFALFGASLAAGLPFGAAAGLNAHSSANPVTLLVAAAVAQTLLEAPIHVVVRERIRALREAIDRAAASQDVFVTWAGDESMPRLGFRGQEDAPAAAMAERFAVELAESGCRMRGPLLVDASLRRDAATQQSVEQSFARAFVRIRALLVEFNSHLSGGLPWPFSTGRPVFRERGLTFYRFPRRAEVDVDANGVAMRIAFGKSQLGPVTSSGFFVPTRIVGDATLTIRYVLKKWNAGPDSACLGLFFQNEASTARYYAQVISTADKPEARSVAAGLAGNVVGRRAIEGDEGWLRLARIGSLLVVSWRGSKDAAWIELGRCDATSDALIAGCKIWSKVETEGLVADLFELEIDGEVAKEQPELLAPRVDPRRG